MSLASYLKILIIIIGSFYFNGSIFLLVDRIHEWNDGELKKKGHFHIYSI